jgi:hypothetical protein
MITDYPPYEERVYRLIKALDDLALQPAQMVIQDGKPKLCICIPTPIMATLAKELFMFKRDSWFLEEIFVISRKESELECYCTILGSTKPCLTCWHRALYALLALGLKPRGV